MSALTSDVTNRTTTKLAQDYFIKPLDLNRLKLRIAELIQPEILAQGN